MKAYCSIGMNGEIWSMCPIRRNSLLVHAAYPQILGTNGLNVVVVVVVVSRGFSPRGLLNFVNFSSRWKYFSQESKKWTSLPSQCNCLQDLFEQIKKVTFLLIEVRKGLFIRKKNNIVNHHHNNATTQKTTKQIIHSRKGKKSPADLSSNGSKQGYTNRAVSTRTRPVGRPSLHVRDRGRRRPK